MTALRFEFAGMGCPCELHVDTDSLDDAHTALAIVQTEVLRLDRKYSHYRGDSLLAQIASLAGSAEFLDVDDETVFDEFHTQARRVHGFEQAGTELSVNIDRRPDDLVSDPLGSVHPLLRRMTGSKWLRQQKRRKRCR